MNETRSGQRDPDGPVWYQIRLKGHLASRWSAWFGGLTLTREDGGTTLIEGAVIDQSELHGLLQRIRDTGLPLLSLTSAETCGSHQPAAAPPD